MYILTYRPKFGLSSLLTAIKPKDFDVFGHLLHTCTRHGNLDLVVTKSHLCGESSLLGETHIIVGMDASLNKRISRHVFLVTYLIDRLRAWVISNSARYG